MTSTIEVKKKTVGDREVISFSKLYSGEEHEVFAPTNQGIQVMLSLLTTINDEKDEDDQFVLVRKRDVGGLNVEKVDANDELYKREAVRSVVESFFDDEMANQVQSLIEDYE